jgi:DNA primase
MKDKILARLDKEAFFRREIGELPRPRGDEIVVSCPFHEDTNPSFSVNLKTGLFKCFGCGAQGDVFAFYQKRHGCDFKEALASLSKFAGVENQKQPWGKIVAEYSYENETGMLLFQVVRLEPKSFRQRRPDGNGDWVWNLQGVKLVPYHLPALATANRVWIVEGE